MIPSALKCSRSVELVRSAATVDARTRRTRRTTFGKLRLFLPSGACQHHINTTRQRAKVKTDRLSVAILLSRFGTNFLHRGGQIREFCGTVFQKSGDFPHLCWGAEI